MIKTKLCIQTIVLCVCDPFFVYVYYCMYRILICVVSICGILTDQV